MCFFQLCIEAPAVKRLMCRVLLLYFVLEVHDVVEGFFQADGRFLS
jgi:hypothetical protein